MGIREDLIPNNRFIVILGQKSYSFSKVTNISESIELEAVTEGGFNSSPRLFRKPKGRVETLVLEKGMQGNEEEAELKVGTRVYVALIIVLNESKIAKRYSFEEGIITKWETGELDASGKGLLIRRVEISHTGLEEC